MTKKYVFTLLGILAFAGVMWAMTPMYTTYLVNDPALAFDKNYEIDLNASHVDFLTVQSVVSSATITSGDFNNGTVSTGAVTVSVNSGFDAVKSSDSITVNDAAGVKARNTITISSNPAIGGAVLTVNGYALKEGVNWTKADVASNTAVSLATAIRVNGHGVTAISVSSVVFATATTAGDIGNSYTLVSSTPTALVLGSANFTLGAQPTLENAILTVNGKPYRNGTGWRSVGTSTGTAINLASFLSNTFSGITSTATGSVCYATATALGSAGNNFTLASSTAALLVASANFTGGADSATVTINGVQVLYGTDWSSGSTSSATAKSISDSIMANGTLNTIVSSTWSSSAVVTITALTAGPNYSLAALPAASFTLTGQYMTGGAVTGIDTSTDTITIASNGFGTSLQVLFSTLTASTPPAPLTNQTTYYTIKVDGNTIRLATSATNAQTNIYLNLTTQGTTNKTFRLTPLGITGTPAWKWQVSNDDTNWSDLGVTSVTLASPYTSTTTYWDFGNTNTHYIRLKVTGPTAGAINIKVKPNGKANNP